MKQIIDEISTVGYARLAMTGQQAHYPMKVASRRTGLTPHVIRVWERRYSAVTPERTESNRRMYSDADIRRLQLLRRATQAGHSIGQIAGLGDERLQALVESEAGGPRAVRAAPGGGGMSAGECRGECLAAVAELDAGRLEAALSRGAVALTQPSLIDDVVLPVLDEVGEQWRSGKIKVAQEHPASAVVRTFLGGLLSGCDSPDSAPVLAATTPAGQRHELGALIAALTAAAQGWKALYLGPDLPAEEIAAAAQRSGAKAVALSMVYPPDDPSLFAQLEKLRRSLPSDTLILAGGRCAPHYSEALDAIGAIVLRDIPGLRLKLDELRQRVE